MLSLYSISPHSKEFTHALAVGEGAAFILYGRSYALDDLQGPSDCQWMIPGTQLNEEPRNRKHVHNWVPTDNWLIDRCSVCGEERA